jgi:hypothetical protein
MDEMRTFAHGFTRGWLSVLGPRLILPKIPAPPIQTSGTDYIRGLMGGIEAAKKKLAEKTSSSDDVTAFRDF